MKIFLTCLITSLLMGCTTIHSIVEVEHISHALQHVRKNPKRAGCTCGPTKDVKPLKQGKTSFGADLINTGVRIRPVDGMQIDILEGYSFRGQVHGQRETFTLRFNYEFGSH